MLFHVLSDRFLRLLGLALALTLCQICIAQDKPVLLDDAAKNHYFLNRISWGANSNALREMQLYELDTYLQRQLHPPSPPTLKQILPPTVIKQAEAMESLQQPLEALVYSLEQERQRIKTIANDEQKNAAHKTYQQTLNKLAQEAAIRLIWRNLYSPHQLQENMTWFWLNHFSVFAGKHELRALVGDYTDNAIRPNALGKFRTLLQAVMFHPAMLRYLDNDRNSVHHNNENYARELFELHTLGIDGGYTQNDVQELARILTGLGVNTSGESPPLRPKLQAEYIRRGLFEFNPRRHDYTEKTLLGRIIQGKGLAEIERVIDILCQHPATARNISKKMAGYFLSDEPSPALIQQMAQRFHDSDGDIPVVLSVLFQSTEFKQSLGKKFQDPIHYVLAALRLVYGDTPIRNPLPILHWLKRLDQAPYSRTTPDGYPLQADAWNSAGQLALRFEIAKQIGSGRPNLLGDPDVQASPSAIPHFSTNIFEDGLAPNIRQALAQARNQAEWNTLYLASPAMMYR